MTVVFRNDGEEPGEHYSESELSYEEKIELLIRGYAIHTSLFEVTKKRIDNVSDRADSNFKHIMFLYLMNLCILAVIFAVYHSGS